jgi:GxxExxY protein
MRRHLRSLTFVFSSLQNSPRHAQSTLSPCIFTAGYSLKNSYTLWPLWFVVFFVTISWSKFKLWHKKIVKLILDEAIYIHKTVGPGMLENVYKNCLVYRLRKRGLSIQVEKPIPVFFEDVRMECGYRADIVAENSIIVDTKSIEVIGPLQIAQVLTYLRFLNMRYGLILNFNAILMKEGIKRVLNGF